MLRSVTPRTDPQTVQDLIDTFATLTEHPGTEGVTRIGYSALERRAHAIFGDFMTDAGWSVSSDAAGNTHALLVTPEQRAAGIPFLGSGSHLDSVPMGGRFDGIVGVVAAMLAGRSLGAGTPLHHPLHLIVFANEEGARFGQACNGSRALAGLLTDDDLDRLHDRDGMTLREAMLGVGLRPGDLASSQLRAQDWQAFIETHIEQGSVLADHGIQIGSVSTISGSTRTQLVWNGIPSHSGGTPMGARSDALVAASRLVLWTRDYAADPARAGLRATVGRLDVSPDSITTIPGKVSMAVDVRDVDPDRQRETARLIVEHSLQIAEEEHVTVAATPIADVSPTPLAKGITAASGEAARHLGYSRTVLPSGASHDTQMMTRICPTGMIFVPSRNHGISHAPGELSTPEDIARGVDVLSETLRILDEMPLPQGGRS